MQVSTQNTDVKKSCEILNNLSQDEEMRLQAENREKALRDEMDRLEGAQKAGMKAGLKAIQRKHIFNMFKKGLSPEEISTTLGEPLNLVKEILKLS